MLYEVIRALFPRFDYAFDDRPRFELPTDTAHGRGRWLDTGSRVDGSYRALFVGFGRRVLILSLSK